VLLRECTERFSRGAGAAFTALAAGFARIKLLLPLSQAE